MITITTSRHMSMAAHVISVGRWVITVTNRPRLFEERDIPAIRGWWIRIIRRAKALQDELEKLQGV